MADLLTALDQVLATPEAQALSLDSDADRAQLRELVASAVADQLAARTLADYHEDFGTVLWWMFPVTEPPYVGSPLDDDWPGYHTHWTPLPPCPENPR